MFFLKSAICVQNPPSSLVKFNISEDCLYLNIYIPPGDNDDVFPVMFWIFGGSFVEGSGEFYDGISFSRKHKVIVVNFNYRLGPFGFLALTELQKEDSNYPSTGFYGIQVLLLFFFLFSNNLNLKKKRTKELH